MRKKRGQMGDVRVETGGWGGEGAEIIRTTGYKEKGERKVRSDTRKQGQPPKP